MADEKEKALTRFMLTTIDNPFDPFKEFNSWFLYDVEKGYNSSAYLARIARTSNEFSDQENENEIESAIDEIIKYDFRNIYKKVSNSDDLYDETYNIINSDSGTEFLISERP